MENSYQCCTNNANLYHTNKELWDCMEKAIKNGVNFGIVL